MGEHQPRSALPAIARAGTGLINLTPSRSKTDPPATTEKPHNESAHLRRRLHANTITGRDTRRHRARAKDTVQSAIDLKPPVSLEHLLRREKERHSLEISRQNSEQWKEAERLRVAKATQDAINVQPKVKPVDVQNAKADNEKREVQLREALQAVEEVGMQSTRQLDDTYYAILDKASILRGMVSNLRLLAEEIKTMHQRFAEDTETVEQETKKTLDGFGNFEQQETAINELVEKLRHSQKETEALNKRLEDARTRVEAYEQREDKKESTRRRQWHATWGVLIGVLVLVVAIVVLKHHRSVASQLDGVGKVLFDLQNDTRALPDMITAQSRPTPSKDPYLEKLFEEL